MDIHPIRTESDYLAALKTVEPYFDTEPDPASGRALQQLKERGYGEKYAGRGEPVYLIGVEFSRGDRNIVGFEVESG